MSGIGDNSISSERLKSFVERIERLEEERANISSDLRDIYTEAQGTGFDKATIRKIVQTRKKLRENAEKHREQMELFDLYAGSLGMEV